TPVGGNRRSIGSSARFVNIGARTRDWNSEAALGMIASQRSGNAGAEAASHQMRGLYGGLVSPAVVGERRVLRRACRRSLSAIDSGDGPLVDAALALGPYLDAVLARHGLGLAH